MVQGITAKDKHGHNGNISLSASRSLAKFIFKMPCLTDLEIVCTHVDEVFYSTASAIRPSSKVTVDILRACEFQIPRNR